MSRICWGFWIEIMETSLIRCFWVSGLFVLGLGYFVGIEIFGWLFYFLGGFVSGMTYHAHYHDSVTSRRVVGFPRNCNWSTEIAADLSSPARENKEYLRFHMGSQQVTFDAKGGNAPLITLHYLKYKTWHSYISTARWQPWAPSHHHATPCTRRSIMRWWRQWKPKTETIIFRRFESDSADLRLHLFFRSISEFILPKG